MFPDTIDFEKLCELLNYTFKNTDLLQQAITRKSGFLECQQKKSKNIFDVELQEIIRIGHNERLEFLGDSVLRTVIDDVLFSIYPEWNEEKLSTTRDEIVSKNGFFSEVAEELQLEQFIILGKGEQADIQGKGRKRILNNVMEAIIAAIFIDSEKDYQVIETFIYNLPKFQYAQAIIDKRLYEAVSSENLQRINYWITQGANPNTVQADRYSISCPADYTSRNEHKGVFWPEVDRYHDGLSSPLDVAIRRSECNKDTLAIIETLLRHGANPNDTSIFQTPLLHQTIIYYCKDKKYPFISEICKLLCQYGANVNLRAPSLCCLDGKKNSQSTPMELAVMSNNKQIITMLLGYGAVSYDGTSSYQMFESLKTLKQNTKKVEDGNRKYRPDLHR